MELGFNIIQEVKKLQKLIRNTAQSCVFQETEDFTLNAYYTNNTYELNSGSEINVTLTSASGLNGKKYTFKNSGSVTHVLNTVNGETIDGSTTYNLNSGNSVTIQSNNTNWIII